MFISEKGKSLPTATVCMCELHKNLFFSFILLNIYDFMQPTSIIKNIIWNYSDGNDLSCTFLSLIHGLIWRGRYLVDMLPSGYTQ